MPAPRQLGNRSKEIIEGIESLLIDNGMTFYDVMLEISREDFKAAAVRARDGVQINQDALRAATLLLGGRFDEADAVLAEARKHSKGGKLK